MASLIYFSRMSLSRNKVNLQKLRLLQQHGFRVICISSYGDVPDNGTSFTEYTNLERKVRLLNQTGFITKVLNYLVFAGHVLIQALKERPQILALHDSVQLPMATALKRVLGCRLVVDFHEIVWDCGYSPAISKLYGSIERRFAPAVDLALFPNGERARLIQEHSPLHCPVVVYPNLPLLQEESARETEAKPGLRLIYFGSVNRTNITSLRAVLQKLVASGFEIDIYPLGEFADDPHRIMESSQLRFLPPFDGRQLPNVLPRYTASICTYDLTSLNNRYCAPRKVYDSIYFGVPVITNGIVTPQVDPLVCEFVVNLDHLDRLSAEQIPRIPESMLPRIRSAYRIALEEAEAGLLFRLNQLTPS